MTNALTSVEVVHSEECIHMVGCSLEQRRDGVWVKRGLALLEQRLCGREDGDKQGSEKGGEREREDKQKGNTSQIASAWV